MGWILLTNDDGVDSPAIPPFATALGRLGEVRVVVPDRERSWIGKAITRFEPVLTEQTERDGVSITTTTGFPADSAQLGIHTLFDTRPDVVVSGINVGMNHGAAFLMSSGTVGAATEGWISGLPAVAFSTGPQDENYYDWVERAHTPEAKREWAAMADTCASLLELILSSGLAEAADVVSVNLPFGATMDTPRRITSIARVGYDQLFTRTGPNRYEHGYTGMIEFDALDGTDVECWTDGEVSITPIRMPQAVDVPDGLRERVEGPERETD